MDRMEKNKKTVWLAGIGMLLVLAVGGVIAVKGKSAGSDRKEENTTGQAEEDRNMAKETEDGAITAMYIPFGEEGHVFIGEQSGPFTATFPEEIYDAEGNLIKKEQLAKGNVIKIYGNGIMLESYPGQYPGITRMEVVKEGNPSDADAYQELINEFYHEPDPSQPPTLNVEYRTDLAVVTVMVGRGGYEWVYLDEDGLSNAVVADSLHVLDWEEIADLVLEEPVDVTLRFSEKPKEVEIIRYDASYAGKAQENPEGEKVTAEEKEGELVLKGVDGGYIYNITAKWENGRATYGFVTIAKD